MPGLGSDMGAYFLFDSSSRLHSTQTSAFNSATSAYKSNNYSQAKLANIIYAAELSRRYPHILSVSVHPGVVKTGLVTNLPPVKRAFVGVTNWIQGMLEPHQGCWSQLWVAAAAKRDELVNGAFYMPVGVESNSMLDKTAKDEMLARRLWEWTDEVLAKY